MYVIKVNQKGNNLFDIMVFDPSGRFMFTWSRMNLTAIQAYVYVRGLGILIRPQINDTQSVATWNYITAIFNTEGNQN